MLLVPAGAQAAVDVAGGLPAGSLPSVTNAPAAIAAVTTVTVPTFLMAKDSSEDFFLTLSADQPETLEGFTLIVNIVPQAGAVGSVEFTAVTEPAVDYVFAGNSAGFGGQVNTPTQAGAFDTTNSGSVTFSMPPVNAVMFTVQSSADAQGFWDLEIDTGTFALDGRGADASENLVNGMVEVPEPTTLSLLALGGLALVRRRRR